MHETGTARRRFLVLFAIVSVTKIVIAAQLPLFVDEAFYWLEGQHLAVAYSDLPGMTAWLARLGVEAGGHHALALRATFLLVAACVPWLIVRIAAREFGEQAGWQAGSIAMLLPLAGTLGLLALPDVAMALATLLCIDAAARMLREVRWTGAAEMALGLSIGALSHYRYAAVLGAGLVALLLLPEGRRVLRDRRTWIAILAGALAWLPLLAWNVDNADAGLRFQLVDRHPWTFDAGGFWFIAIQCVLVTPLLFCALGNAAWSGLRDSRPTIRFFAIFGSFIVIAFFLLGFVADRERVSFHWPLPGYLALVLLLPATLARWPRAWRAATWATATLGVVAFLAWFTAVSLPAVRAHAAAGKWYPSNFAGWAPLADAVREVRATLPAGTRLVADNFKLGAEVGFALGDPDIAVLDHPLNHKHGRAPQLAIWNLDFPGANRAHTAARPPTLLMVGMDQVKFSGLLAHYQGLCERLGPLPPPRFVSIDHGQQRFALFALPAVARAVDATTTCVTPALAHINTPEPGSQVPAQFEVEGWAVQDQVGVSRVTITLDGEPVADATMRLPNLFVPRFWKGRSRDPDLPDVAFRAQVDASQLAPGRHWLGMTLHGADGSVQQWAERPIDIVR